MATRKKEVPIVDIQNCGSCRFFYGNKEDTLGYCRRYPPVLYQSSDGAEFVQSVVEAAEWCGEYQRKLDS